MCIVISNRVAKTLPLDQIVLVFAEHLLGFLRGYKGDFFLNSFLIYWLKKIFELSRIHWHAPFFWPLETVVKKQGNILTRMPRPFTLNLGYYFILIFISKFYSQHYIFKISFIVYIAQLSKYSSVWKVKSNRIKFVQEMAVRQWHKTDKSFTRVSKLLKF